MRSPGCRKERGTHAGARRRRPPVSASVPSTRLWTLDLIVLRSETVFGMVRKGEPAGWGKGKRSVILIEPEGNRLEGRRLVLVKLRRTAAGGRWRFQQPRREGAKVGSK